MSVPFVLSKAPYASNCVCPAAERGVGCLRGEDLVLAEQVVEVDAQVGGVAHDVAARGH